MNLLKENYNGILGVKLIDSGKPGPIIGISACTHGGEVVGLDVIDYLENYINLQKNICKGKIFLILSNIRAYEKYLSLSNGKLVNEEILILSRFIDENMNRCCSKKNLENSNSYEVKRINELYGILSSLDIHFDIHSTYNPSEGILISTEKSHKNFKDVFNTDLELVDITKIQVGKPFIDITERGGGVGIGIETGYQLDEEGYKVGLDNVCRLLIDLGMIDIKDVNKGVFLDKKNKQVIKIIDSVMITSLDFIPAKTFSHKEKVKKGELLATVDGKKIYAEDDFLVIFPSKTYKHITNEEFCFLGKEVK